MKFKIFQHRNLIDTYFQKNTKPQRANIFYFVHFSTTANI